MAGANDCVTIRGYGRPSRIAPRWYVGYLTFQGGNPNLPRDSLTGGGVIPPVSFSGRFRPEIKGYAPGVDDLAGGGSVIARPLSTLGLLRPSRAGGSQTV